MKAADSYPEKEFWSYITVTFWIHLLVKKVKCVNTSTYSTASKINVVWRTWYAAGGQTGLLKEGHDFFLVRFISHNSHFVLYIHSSQTRECRSLDVHAPSALLPGVFPGQTLCEWLTSRHLHQTPCEWFSWFHHCTKWEDIIRNDILTNFTDLSGVWFFLTQIQI